MSTKRYDHQPITLPGSDPYSVTRGVASFDWNLFLDRAIAKKTSKREENRAFNRSASWVTCACGNACSIIPRREWGEPIDGRLQDLGCIFMEMIFACEWSEAKKALAAIEVRSSELIAQLRA